MSPAEFAPTTQAQLEWPKWGQYLETKGKTGEAPDLPGAVTSGGSYQSWLDATESDARAGIWHEMLRIWADEVYSIGTVAGVQQPVVVSARLRNVPSDGMFSWDPGAQFGIYKPDGFRFDRNATPATAAALTRDGH